ncbi:MAG: protoporphyrinogen oxidase [Candidatus Omnitrophica bacterium]|nr:protoporphyrinogen oxidase [Candidatus Omnitrophota bacterium]
MAKTIVIIGAGISGLSLHYFLKKRYSNRPDVRIVLLEKNDGPGGNIRTLFKDNVLFECGPNGFLANQPATLSLIEDLGLTDQLVSADPSANRRYILVNGHLHQVPSNLGTLLKFKSMKLSEKLRIFWEPFVSKGNDPEESLDHFIRRRFGSACAKYLADPMVSGIYAGDSSHLSVQMAFPKVYEYEQKFGSVIKGLSGSRQDKIMKGGLKSFQKGMGQLILGLAQAAGEALHINEPVRQVLHASPYYLVVTDHEKYAADELFICSPSYAAADLLHKLDSELALALKSIEYASISVVGLEFSKASFERICDGFGYLVPSFENSVVLGVLFESQIFQNRAPEKSLMVRVMIGGVRNPQCVQWSEEQLIQTACQELTDRFGIKEEPLKKFLIKYSKAIPQYETQGIKLKGRIHERLLRFDNLYLRSNYLDGVSLNECVKNSKELASRSNL